MAEAAAYAYDRAAYKLCGEYTKVNFLNLQDPSQFGLFGDTERLNALKSVVDARIQSIFEKVKREKGNRKKNKKKMMRECESVVKIEDCSSVSCVGSGLMTSPSASEDGFGGKRVRSVLFPVSRRWRWRWPVRWRLKDVLLLVCLLMIRS
ncbi:hypothetical protein L1987_14547 [Smallanthus sonchifolius]|uniref:Uncharacterized protein n=1 Tax=Smallanthus sonchifolius TaxID=185202 RepID=A0ACB9J557_9ASTR|nr:hypothetical protein L1987_14547 [Smallanthus sonchifolius]